MLHFCVVLYCIPKICWNTSLFFQNLLFRGTRFLVRLCLLWGEVLLIFSLFGNCKSTFLSYFSFSTVFLLNSHTKSVISWNFVFVHSYYSFQDSLILCRRSVLHGSVRPIIVDKLDFISGKQVICLFIRYTNLMLSLHFINEEAFSFLLMCQSSIWSS